MTRPQSRVAAVSAASSERETTSPPICWENTQRLQPSADVAPWAVTCAAACTPSSSKASKIKAFKEHFSIKTSAPTPVWDHEPRGRPLQLPRRNLSDALVSALASALASALPASPAASAPPPPQLCRFFSNTDKCPQSSVLFSNWTNETFQWRTAEVSSLKCPPSLTFSGSNKTMCP